MSPRSRARLTCAALLLACTGPAHAEPLTLDLSHAVARAREHAPEAIAALASIGEARARRVGAGVLFEQNPEIEFGAGPRLGDRRTLTIDSRIAQPLELGRRGARIAAADAGIAHARATSDADLRVLDYEVTTAFYEARFAELAVEQAQRELEIATRADETAVRRRKAGEITDLDAGLAHIALGRARAGLAATRSVQAAAIGRLGALVGARPEDTITLTGELRAPTLSMAELQAALPGRADVRALAAESQLARAELDVAVASGRPDVALWVGYERDEGDPIVLGGIALVLPIWNAARRDKAVARAKQQRADRQHSALAGAAARQVSDAFAAYVQARDAVDAFERDVLPTLSDSEQLVERSLDSGQLTIADYLGARREIASAHHEHLQRQLELAKAAAAARFAAGVTP